MPVMHEACVASDINVLTARMGLEGHAASAEKTNLVIGALDTVLCKKRIDTKNWCSEFTSKKSGGSLVSLAEALYGSNYDDSVGEKAQDRVNRGFNQGRRQELLDRPARTRPAMVDVWIGATSGQIPMDPDDVSFSDAKTGGKYGTFAPVRAGRLVLGVSPKSQYPVITASFPPLCAYSMHAPVIRLQRHGERLSTLCIEIVPERTENSPGDDHISFESSALEEEAIDAIFRQDVDPEISLETQGKEMWSDYSTKPTAPTDSLKPSWQCLAFTLPRQLAQLFAQFIASNLRLHVVANAANTMRIANPHVWKSTVAIEEALLSEFTDGKTTRQCMVQVRAPLHASFAQCLCQPHIGIHSERKLCETGDPNQSSVLIECCGREVDENKKCPFHTEVDHAVLFGRCLHHATCRIWCQHNDVRGEAFDTVRTLDHEVLITRGEQLAIGSIIATAQNMRDNVESYARIYKNAPSGEYFKACSRLFSSNVRALHKHMFDEAMRIHRRSFKSTSAALCDDCEESTDSCDVHDLDTATLDKIDKQAARLLSRDVYVRIGLSGKGGKIAKTAARYDKYRRLRIDKRIVLAPSQTSQMLQLFTARTGLLGRRSVTKCNAQDIHFVNEIHARLFPCLNDHWTKGSK